MIFDLVIIGAGPAGLSAAIHAKRFDLNCIVLERDTPGGQARAANWITNYPGFPNGISGRELMGLFVEQAEAAGAKIEKCEVKKIHWKDNCYEVESPSPLVGEGRGEGGYRTKSIILATGLEPVRLGGEGIYYYPIPEDVPHEGKNVLVIGGGDSAFDEAISFFKEAAHVTIAMRSDRPRALKELVKRASDVGVKIMAGMTEGDIAKLRADITIACCGKRQNLNILDPSLQATSHQPPATLQLAGDIAHPNIRHIAAAVGDGVRSVEEILDSSFVT